ncbi:MAG TPA: hypothetical protein PKL08_04860, partial [Thermoanaerobaculaceae bacterium]|nr:hypothetical protein [Thermoanaerobaculaceae bacterium]
AGGVLAGIALSRSPEAAAVTGALLAAVLAIPVLWLVLRPLLPGEAGADGREELPRILPIPSRFLRHFELVRVLLDPIVLVFSPGVLLVPLGALVAGRVALAGLALVAGVAFVALLAAGGAVVALGVRLLLRDRRRGEVATLLFLLLLSTVGLLPQLFLSERQAGSGAPSAAAAGHQEVIPEKADARIPTFLLVLPSGLYGLALGNGAEGAWWQAARRVAGLAGLAAGAYLIAAPLHRRLLTTPARGDAPRLTRSVATRHRIPFLDDATAAVAGVTLRMLLRTVRGRMLLLSPLLLGVVFALMASRAANPGMALFATPLGVAILLAVMPLVSVQVLASNQFAIGSGGLVLELLLPVPVRAMVRGRAIAFLVVGTTCVLVGQVPVLLLLRGPAPPLWWAILLATVSVELLLAPVVGALAAVFPKTADLAALGHAGNPHPAASALTMLAGGGASLVPVGLGIIAVRLLSRPWLAPALMVVWACACLGLARLLLPVVERLVAARRENLGLVAVGR